jgi:hypothetical protein
MSNPAFRKAKPTERPAAFPALVTPSESAAKIISV